MGKDQTRDISSKDIFGNHELCAQFLRNYVGDAGVPFLKNIRAEETRLGRKGIRKRKLFHYPPILPVVYYEGAGSWDSVPELKDRILFSEAFSAYIPDFRYIMVQNQVFSKDELLDRNDEMSLLMLINKIQDPDDLKLLQDISAEKMNSMVAHSSEAVLNVIAATVQALCRKFNMPDQEVNACVGKVRERKMGYLWANMRKVDIQEERLKTQKAEGERDAAIAKLDTAIAKLDSAEKDLEKTKKERDAAKEEQDAAKTALEKEKEENQRIREQLAQAEARLKQLLNAK